MGQARSVASDFRQLLPDENDRVSSSDVRYKPTYYGIYEDNNPARRLVVIANHDNDVAEYWEWSGRGLFPIDSSNEAYKLGINYMLYGLTH